jgi:hypothetical protein
MKTLEHFSVILRHQRLRKRSELTQRRAELCLFKATGETVATQQPGIRHVIVEALLILLPE